ncbi:MAG: cysteine lyase [Nitrospirales bacterium]|nr:MAG: cysteine lyase [Nitrospirales bacterium]
MIYLNYAASCPIHPDAKEEIETTLTEFYEYLYSATGIQWYRTKVQQCRETVARVLHVPDPSCIAFVPNASTANYVLLSSIDWKQGDIVVSSTHENPSIRNKLLALSHRGVELRFLPPTASPQQFLTSVHDALHEQPIKAIILSHVSHVDGRIFPIPEIAAMAKERHALLLVDGAQAVGHIDVHVDTLQCDAYFFSGYKWCSGPLGTGGLVISQRLLEHAPSIQEKPAPAEQPLASRFEIGSHNIGLIAGLAKACEHINQEGLNTEGLQNIREAVKQQLRQMKDTRVREWDGPQAPGILTFQHQHHTMLMKIFQKHNIVVKPLTEYPEGEIPAMRMSWLGSADTQNVTKTLDIIREALPVQPS